MATWMEEFRARCSKEIENAQEMLELLQTGKMLTKASYDGEPLTDTTQQNIEHYKHTIETYQSLIETIDKNAEAERSYA